MIVPYPRRSLLVEPFMGNGFTDTGIWLQHHVALPPVLGRVTKVSDDCQEVREGDVVVFRAHAPEEVDTLYGTIYVMSETACAAVLHGYDEEAVNV